MAATVRPRPCAVRIAFVRSRSLGCARIVAVGLSVANYADNATHERHSGLTVYGVERPFSVLCRTATPPARDRDQQGRAREARDGFTATPADDRGAGRSCSNRTCRTDNEIVIRSGPDRIMIEGASIKT